MDYFMKVFDFFWYLDWYKLGAFAIGYLVLQQCIIGALKKFRKWEKEEEEKESN
jgi:hypothetical protein